MLWATPGKSRLLISRLKPHRGKGSSGALVAADNFAQFSFGGHLTLLYVLRFRIRKIELQIIENNLPCLKCENLWMHFYTTVLHHGRYVFTVLYIGVSSLVVFSSDVFSRLSFVRWCIRSLRFHRHSQPTTFSDSDLTITKTSPTLQTAWLHVLRQSKYSSCLKILSISNRQRLFPFHQLKSLFNNRN